MDFPEPLTPVNCDLRDFRFMPLEVGRLRRSKEWLLARRTPEIGFYSMNLWAAAWHEVPAGSLEDDDDVLADAAMCDAKRWQRVKADVMRKWVKCSDGRLYHPVVAEKANEAWDAKIQQRQRTEAARRAKEEAKKAKAENSVTGAVTDSVTDDVTEDVTASKGREGKGRDNKKRIQQEPDGFPDFWDAWPKKLSRGDAEKAYRKALDLTDAASLLAAAKRIAAEYEGKDKTYLKYPATWLNAKCWLDEPAAQSAVQAQQDPYADLDDGERRWIAQLTGFHERGFWMDDKWGPKPGEPFHRCPRYLAERYEATRRKGPT